MENNLQKLRELTDKLDDRDYYLKKKVKIYESIIKELVQGIWIIDSNQKTIYADKLVTKMLNVSLEDMKNKSVYEFISDMDKLIARKYINNGSNATKEINFKTKEGKTVKSKTINLVSTDSLHEEGIKFLLVDNSNY